MRTWLMVLATFPLAACVTAPPPAQDSRAAAAYHCQLAGFRVTDRGYATCVERVANVTVPAAPAPVAVNVTVEQPAPVDSVTCLRTGPMVTCN